LSDEEAVAYLLPESLPMPVDRFLPDPLPAFAEEKERVGKGKAGERRWER